MKLIIVVVAMLLLLCTAVARADSAGQIPGPGTCDYPAIGDWGMIGEGVAAEYFWYCDEPAEPANNSHRHCEYQGAASEFNGSISLFVLRVGVSAPVGGVFGGCHYRCPNNALAKESIPNPPGLWLLGQHADLRKGCASVGDPLPVRPEAPTPSPPVGRNGGTGPVEAGPQIVP